MRPSHALAGTMFLYGQTGSGKTTSHEQLMRLAAAHIFGCADQAGRELARVTVSVVELYNEKLRCLLTERDVALRRAPRGGVVLEGAAEKVGAVIDYGFWAWAHVPLCLCSGSWPLFFRVEP
jgi:hypothetical protein